VMRIVPDPPALESPRFSQSNAFIRKCPKTPNRLFFFP
jgi:hypothetical protein